MCLCVYAKNSFLIFLFLKLTCFRFLSINIHQNFTNDKIFWAGHGSRAVACSVFARSEAGTVGSNPTQGRDV
jgi:hypothetical protein